MTKIPASATHCDWSILFFATYIVLWMMCLPLSFQIHTLQMRYGLILFSISNACLSWCWNHLTNIYIYIYIYIYIGSNHQCDGDKLKNFFLTCFYSYTRRCYITKLNQCNCCSWPCDTNTLRWRHNERDEVSNHQRRDCLLNRLFRCSSKK